MSKKEYISVQFNEIKWRVERLGEHVHLLIAPKDISIDKIHESTFLIKKIFGNDLTDIVPSYHSIAVFVEKSVDGLITRLSKSEQLEIELTIAGDALEIPICYEYGLDLNQIAVSTSLSEEEVINIHLEGSYRSLFIGFTPGFVYADGLDDKLECPRKTNPRKRVEAGSIGIGGTQTGIYSLASPGGWNIIGRTPLRIFDQNRSKPLLVDAGTSFKFYRITKEEFETWEN